MSGDESLVEGSSKKVKVVEICVNGESLMCLSSGSTVAFKLVDRTQ